MVASTGGPSKQRTKTFTGCWTCRARHVKCDEEKPHCQRCLRNGWQCEGYNIRLEWSEENSRDNASQRRHAQPMLMPPELCLSPNALAALLSDVDSHAHPTASYMRGPFSVFPASSATSASSSGREAGNSSTSEIASPQPSMGPPSLSADSNDDCPITCTDRHAPHILRDDCQVEPSDTRPETTPSSLSSTLAAGSSGQSCQAIAVRSDAIHEEPDTRSTWADSPDRSNHLQILSLVHQISPYTMPRVQIELIHHWVTFLSGTLLLVDTPDNPCRTLFVPMALQGVDAEDAEFSMNRIVFHAICSASAFSLCHLRQDQRYQALALTHDQLALHHLRHNLDHSPEVNESTLAAVLSCVVAEAISGRRHRWRTHLAGALALLERGSDDRWTRRPAASSMLQSYISLLALCRLRMSPRLVSLLDGPAEMENYLERAHGMTKPLVRFLASLTERMDGESTVTAGEMDGLELQLYLSFPRLSTPDSRNAEVIQHAVNAFYYATVIYFRRTYRRVPPTAVQDLVEKAVENLETAELLSQSKGGTAYNWPGLVVAAECLTPSLQGRMVTWFYRKRRHGLQSIDVIRELVTSLWQRRASAVSDADFHWQDLAKEADFDIMFV